MIRGASICVTGGTGFVGRPLVSALLSAGAGRVLVLSRKPPDLVRKIWNNPRVEVATVDLRDASNVFRSMQPFHPDICVHAASSQVSADSRNWFAGVIDDLSSLLVVLAALQASGCRRFTLLSSAYVYADCEGKLSETSPLLGFSSYGASKASSELLSSAFCKENGIELRVARLFPILGPGEPPGRLFPSLLRAVAAGVPFQASSCTQVRDYVALQDVINGLLLLLQHPHPLPGSPAVNFGRGIGLPLRDLLQTLCASAGLNAHISFGTHPPRPGEPAKLLADISKANQVLGWQPEVSLEQAFKEILLTDYPEIKGGRS